MTTTTTSERQHTSSATESTAETPSRKSSTAEKAATVLGWMRIGLGVSEILAPRKQEASWTARLLGFRQVACGVGMLTNPRSAPGLWMRVSGDVLGMASLVRDEGTSGGLRSAVEMATTVGVATCDVMCARANGVMTDGEPHAIRYSDAVTINKPPRECYQYWRDIENFPNIFPQLKSVRNTGENHSHWIAQGPGDTEIAWDAEITEDLPNEQLAWRSLPGAAVPNSGSVRFEAARGGRGTVLRVRMVYDAPDRRGQGRCQPLRQDSVHETASGFDALQTTARSGRSSHHRGPIRRPAIRRHLARQDGPRVIDLKETLR